jgi:hypothetical protein
MYRTQRDAKVLAAATLIGCNAQSFHFEEHFPMHVKRRRLPNFEACSVALFASRAMGSTPLPARAQGATPATRSLTSSTPSAPAPLRLTLRKELRAPSLPSPDVAPVVPDGSISSPGFDESLK